MESGGQIAERVEHGDLRYPRSDHGVDQKLFRDGLSPVLQVLVDQVHKLRVPFPEI